MEIYTAAIKKCDPRQLILYGIQCSTRVQLCVSGTTHYGRDLPLSREGFNHWGRDHAVLHISTHIELVGDFNLQEKEVSMHWNCEYPPLHHEVFVLELNWFSLIQYAFEFQYIFRRLGKKQ